jgi:hypothetical protein
MKINKLVVSILGGLLIPQIANSGTGRGLVTYLEIYSDPYNVLFIDNGSHENKPPCSTAGTQWALSLVSSNNKALYATILSAQALGKSIIITGNGTCSAWSDRETIIGVQVLQ